MNPPAISLNRVPTTNDIIEPNPTFKASLKVSFSAISSPKTAPKNGPTMMPIGPKNKPTMVPTVAPILPAFVPPKRLLK